MIGRILRLANPLNRAVILGFVWSHRRSIMRWGRSFWNELRSADRIEPGRLALMWKVLWAVTGDDELAKARQLRSLRLDGDVVVVDASRGWRGRSRLVDRLQEVDGVSRVVDVDGDQFAATIETTAR